MIIKKDQQAEVLSNFDTDSIDMTIDDSDKQVLMHILSTGLYQDPIGSLIRENVSNNLDATVEAGSSEPVIVGIRQDSAYNWYFYSQDFGTGISPDRMLNIVSKYAASTKRNDAKQKGLFGLGLKAGLAYTDSFHIITIFNGIEYNYLMYKGDDGSKIELLDEKETTERNGTTFKVYIKNNNYNDRCEFQRKIKEQLSYINSLYFDIVDYDNNYTIYKSDHFWYTQNQTDQNLHIVLDGIYYPIDFNKLGISPIRIPIGLKMELTDGIVPTPSRESFIMSPATKQLILDKIKLVATDLVNRHNESVTDIDNFADYLEVLRNGTHYITIGDKKISINSIESFSEVEIKEPTFSQFKSNYNQMPSLIEAYKYSIFQESASSKMTLGFNRVTHSTKSVYMTISSIINSRFNRGVLVEGETDKLKIEYLRDTIKTDTYLFRYKFSPMKLGKNSNTSGWERYTYRTVLGLDKHPRSEWRGRIKELQDFEKFLVDTYIEKLNDIVVPDEWIQKRKEDRKALWKVRKEKEKGTFVFRKVSCSNRSDWGGSYTTEDVKLENVRKFEGLHVYDSMENKEKLAILRQTFWGSRIKVCILAKCNMYKVEDLKNFITFDDFMKGQNRPFIYYATCLKVANIIKNASINNIVLEISRSAPMIDPTYSELASKIDSYEKSVSINNKEFTNTVLEFAEQNNLINKYMIQEAEEFVKKVKEFEFLSFVIDFEGYRVNQETREQILAFCKEVLTSRRLKKKKNPELFLETEIVTEENIEEGEEVIFQEEII